MAHDFALDIAGVRCQLWLPESNWLAPLAARFAEFAAPVAALENATPAWDVVVVHADGHSVLDAPWAAHEGDVTRFGVSDHEGWIDLEQRRAEVSASSAARAASAVDRVIAYICMQALPREHDSILLHGAAIVLDGMGLACCGPSGAGKTTLSRLAVGHADVLTDETLVVSLAGPQPMLVSTPFWGASTPPDMVQRCNRRLPLHALLLLEHGSEFSLERLEPGQAALSLLATDKVAVERVSSALAWLAVVEHLVAQTPVYRLASRPTTDVWPFLLDALSPATR